ncbi:hypothetical protein JAAARDRAFT_28257 [Jaapia argillacea MUCL 33604]|uniref:Uncharacterized protein n=1 Tax=Jaapia argillacea MUCL 33604 TaxID=933084 RepID=A0A067QPQ1_9AGAM|nr:hypothetical protein JAAARDRAFT_28257 [Jaapia argillacea MUCL 33604]
MSESTEKRINNYLSASKRHQAKSDPDSDKDDDDLFAELEAELEDDNAYAREHGLEQLKRE